MDDPAITQVYFQLFDQIWKDPTKVADVTELIREHIAAVYQENPPQLVYFLILFHIFNEFLEEVSEDVLPNERTGYQDSVIWQKLYHFQKDAATGIINKLETYNGCILADSVGLGKTFTALAVIKYYELRNRTVLVLCPKKLSDNWNTYKGNLKNNPLVKDRFSFDVLCHTDLLRERGESLGMPLSRVNWSNYDLVVIDESHNFRNDDAFKDRETRYQWLMNRIIKQGVRTKVLMLSATPVNNRFNDLKNQLAPSTTKVVNPGLLVQKLKATQQHRPDFPPGPGRFQCLVQAARRRTHATSDSGYPGLRLLRAPRRGHHRSLSPPHHYVLRHQGDWRISHTPQTTLLSLSDHEPPRCDWFQRYFSPAHRVEAGSLHPGQLHSSQPPFEIRGDVRHGG